MLKLLNLTMASIVGASATIAATLAPSQAALLEFNADNSTFRLDTRTGKVFSTFDSSGGGKI